MEIVNVLNFIAVLRGRYVDFYGDFIDPFCYVGFHNLRVAAEEARLLIRWRGFEMSPDTPPEGAAFQTAQNSDLRAGMWASVGGFAQKAGLEISDPGFVPKTQAAHRLVLNWRGDLRVKNPLIERIYQAYLSDKKNIGDDSILIEIASRFGVSHEACQAMLKGDVQKLLRRHEKAAVAARFPGLPAYRFQTETLFGALSAAQWRRVFKT